MSEPRSDFWNSDLPFISSAADKRVDWIDVGLTALLTVATSYFTSIANVLGALWQTFIITPLEGYADAYESYVSSLLSVGSGALDFTPATEFARDAGLIGSLILITIGAYLIAYVVGRVIR
jgi:hypothetical protein